MAGFGFVEFESSRDAEDAMQNFNGKNFMGSKYAFITISIIFKSLIFSQHCC